MTSLFTRLSQRKGLLSFLCALPLTFAYAPFDLWFLPFLCLPLFFWINQEVTPKQALRSGFCFGLGWFGAGISWVHVSIDQFGGMPLVVSILLMALLCAYLSIYPALSLYVARKLLPTGRLWLWLIPSCWLVFEYLRGVVLTGFPWLSLGYTQLTSPFSSLATVIGETGLSFSVVLIAIALYNLSQKSHRFFAIAVLVVYSGTTAFVAQQQWLTETNKTASTVLVQGNIAQDIKWNPEQEWPTMLKYADLSRPHYGADIVLWPEAAVPAVEPLALEYLSNLDRAFTHNGSSLVTGIINYNFETKEFFNTLVVAGKKYADDTDGHYHYPHANRYYKHHLLPIGEFVPFGEILRPIAPLFNLPMSSFTRGDYVQQNLTANGFKLLPLICFEVAFTDQLAASFNEQTQILLTVSNDAWFGNSHGPHQHLQIAQMRALEYGRPMLRATNNGVTAIINHQGKVTDQLPQFVEGVLTGDVAIVEGLTPFSRFGNLVFWLLIAIGLMPKAIASFKAKP